MILIQGFIWKIVVMAFYDRNEYKDESMWHLKKCVQSHRARYQIWISTKSYHSNDNIWGMEMYDFVKENPFPSFEEMKETINKELRRIEGKQGNNLLMLEGLQEYNEENHLCCQFLYENSMSKRDIICLGLEVIKRGGFFSLVLTSNVVCMLSPLKKWENYKRIIERTWYDVENGDMEVWRWYRYNGSVPVMRCPPIEYDEAKFQAVLAARKEAEATIILEEPEEWIDPVQEEIEAQFGGDFTSEELEEARFFWSRPDLWSSDQYSEMNSKWLEYKGCFKCYRDDGFSMISSPHMEALHHPYRTCRKCKWQPRFDPLRKKVITSTYGY